MSAKAKRIIWITLMALPLAMITMSGIMKISGNKELVEGLSKIGFGSYITFMGILELASVALFIYPKTYKLGFLMLTAYLGGAISTELATGRPPMAAAFLTLIWISVFIRNREMFLPSKVNKQTESDKIKIQVQELEMQKVS
jgi:hypothetical protein